MTSASNLFSEYPSQLHTVSENTRKHWIGHRPQTTDQARDCIMKVAFEVSMPDFAYLAIRGMNMNALNQPGITNDSCCFAVGHEQLSGTFSEAYLSHQMTINVQGIVLNGAENHQAIMNHGLCQVNGFETNSLLRRLLPATELDKLDQETNNLAQAARTARGVLDQQKAEGAPDKEIAQLEDAFHYEYCHLIKTCHSLMVQKLEALAHLHEESRKLNALLSGTPQHALDELWAGFNG